MVSRPIKWTQNNSNSCSSGGGGGGDDDDDNNNNKKATIGGVLLVFSAPKSNLSPQKVLLSPTRAGSSPVGAPTRTESRRDARTK